MTPISLATVQADQVTASTTRGVTPTDEQTAAVDIFKSGAALVLEAGAGTGKTSTLRLMANELPFRTGVYVAYNKAIALDAKASFPSNVTAATAHSYAYQAVGKRYRDRLKSPRVPAWKAAEILGAEALDVGPGRRIPRNAVARIALDTVARYCNSADREIGRQHVPYVEGVEYLDDFQTEIVRLASKAWADLRIDDAQVRALSTKGRTVGVLKFTHDVYLKLWQLGNPRLPGDYILLDEAQDANPVIADVVLRQDAQLIAVGDAQQAIYGWRGAVDAMRDWPAEHRLPLAQSFRFGPAIATAANEWLRMLGATLRLRGLDSINSQVMHLDEPAAILCRTNAQAVGEALLAIEAGRRPAIVGGVEQIRWMCRASLDLKEGRPTDHPELCAFESWADVQEYVEEDEAAADLRVLVGLVDMYGVGKLFSVTDAVVDEPSADVIVSTAHKAKGREWGSVLIAPDFRAPKDGEDLERGEACLCYVAVTRAKRLLDNGALAWASGVKVAGVRNA